jgi:hypothetical protein
VTTARLVTPLVTMLGEATHWSYDVIQVQGDPGLCSWIELVAHKALWAGKARCL